MYSRKRTSLRKIQAALVGDPLLAFIGQLCLTCGEHRPNRVYKFNVFSENCE